MTAFLPAYRFRIYAPRSVDPTEATVLTPAANAPHADPFQVASIQGVAGYQPFLEPPRGRKGQIDILTKRTDAGELVFTLIDKRTSDASNLARWVTGFTGNTLGRHAMAGFKVVADESLVVIADGTRTDWATFWTGRVQQHILRGKTRFDLNVRDMREDLKMTVFPGPPTSAATGVVRGTFLPPGIASAFGAQAGVIPLTGKISLQAALTYQGQAVTRSVIQLDATSMGRLDNLLTENLWSLQLSMQDEVLIQSGAKLFIKGRAHVKRLDTNAEGDFVMVGVNTNASYVKTGGLPIQFVYIQDLPPGEPGGMASPPLNTLVNVYIWSAGPSSSLAPILINDVHPAQVWRDILDGYYGYTWTWAERESFPSGVVAGDVKRKVAYDTTAFTNLIADTRFPKGRWVVTQSADAWDWIEKNILQPYGLGWYLDPSGKVVPIDLRLPTAAEVAAAVTLTDADIVERVDAVGWTHDRGTGITRARATFYTDTAQPIANLAAAAGAQHKPGNAFGVIIPAFAGAMLSSVPSVIEIVDLGSADLGDAVLEIDAAGFRTMAGETVDNQNRLTWLLAKLITTLGHLRAPFGSGGVPMTFHCRRTTVPSGLHPGSLFKSTVSVVPDPGTNRRGGTRVLRCTGKTEDGPEVVIEALDLGINQAAGTPTLGTPVQQVNNTGNGAKIAITLNAGNPVELQYAVTDTGTGAAPADTSSLWSTFDTVRSNRDATIERLPAGMRVWFRGRSVPDPIMSNALLPSTWVNSTSLDLATLAAPSAPTLLTNGTLQFTVGWTVGDATLKTEVRLAKPTTDPRVTIATLLPGSNRYIIYGATANQTYRVGIRHTDGLGGYSAEVTIDVTTLSASAPTIQPPIIQPLPWVGLLY